MLRLVFLLLLAFGVVLGQTIEELRVSAIQGSADAQFNLGDRYYIGQGVTLDYEEAVKWFRLAAERGHPDAQYRLCVYYDLGSTEAAKWCRLAAENGVVAAQLFLAVPYENGEGVPQDHAEAAKWYRLAAEQRDPSAAGKEELDLAALAQFRLGLMYAGGRGVAQDYVEAHKWLNLAASQESNFAEFRDSVAAGMTPAQIAEAQRLAREWKPKTWDELKGQIKVE